VFDSSFATELSLFYFIMAILVRWIVGIIFKFSFISLIYLLQRSLRKGVLWFFRDLNDPDFDFIKEVTEQTLRQHIRRFILSMFLYGFVILVVIWCPVQLCKTFLPSIIPFEFHWSGAYELPFDIVLFRILLPILVKFINLQNSFELFVSWFLHWFASLLDLKSYLFEEANEGTTALNHHTANNDQQRQPEEPQGESQTQSLPKQSITNQRNLRFKLTIFCLGGFATLTMFSFFVLVIPVSIGRFFLLSLYPISRNDLHSFIVGLIFLSAVIQFLHDSLRNSSSNGVSIFLNFIFKSLLKYGFLSLKWMLVLIMCLLIMPILVGLLLELTLLIPFRSSWNESANYLTLYEWWSGLIILNTFFRLVVMDDIFGNSWKVKYDKIKRDGFVEMDFRFIALEMIAPILNSILSFLCIPYVAIHLIAAMNGFSIHLKGLLLHYTYFIIALVLLIIFLLNKFILWFRNFSQKIYNDRYLVGRRLRNLNEAQAKSSDNEVVTTDNSNPNIQQQPMPL